MDEKEGERSWLAAFWRKS